MNNNTTIVSSGGYSAGSGINIKIIDNHLNMFLSTQNYKIKCSNISVVNKNQWMHVAFVVHFKPQLKLHCYVNAQLKRISDRIKDFKGCEFSFQFLVFVDSETSFDCRVANIIF